MILSSYDFFNLYKDNEEEKPQEKYFPSQLGSATLASSMKPDEAIVVYFELQKARRNFCLENELHIVYQVRMLSLQFIFIFYFLSWVVMVN